MMTPMDFFLFDGNRQMSLNNYAKMLQKEIRFKILK